MYLIAGLFVQRQNCQLTLFVDAIFAACSKKVLASRIFKVYYTRGVNKLEILAKITRMSSSGGISVIGRVRFKIEKTFHSTHSSLHM